MGVLNVQWCKSKTREQPLQIILQPNDKGIPYPDGNQENMQRTLNQAIKNNTGIFTRFSYRGGKTRKYSHRTKRRQKKTVTFRKPIKSIK